jgi:hypothetical protein
MAIQTIPVLKDSLNSQINTNGIKGVNGAILNQNVINMVDSLVYYIDQASGGGDNFYSIDGTFTGLRTINMSGNSVVFEKGNIINKAALDDVGYKLQNSLGVEKGSLGYDVGDDSALLELKNTLGTFLKAFDGKVAINSTTLTEAFSVDSPGTGFTNLDVNKSGFKKVRLQGGSVGAIELYNGSNVMDVALLGQHAGFYYPQLTFGNRGNISSAPSSQVYVKPSTGGKGVMYYESTDGAEASLFTNDNRFGFGTITPSERVDVNGNANVSGVYKVGGNSGFTGTGAYTNFTIEGGIITAAT